MSHPLFTEAEHALLEHILEAAVRAGGMSVAPAAVRLQQRLDATDAAALELDDFQALACTISLALQNYGLEHLPAIMDKIQRQLCDSEPTAAED